MKWKAALLFVVFGAVLFAQKREERPKVHTDYFFGAFPTSRDALQEMQNEQSRLIVSAFHEGWSVEKLAKTLKLNEADLTKISDRLEDKRIAGRRDEYDLKPFMPVFREKELALVWPPVRKHAELFTAHFEKHWPELEAFADGLRAARTVPRERFMYELAVSGILLGGMIEAFFEDKTMMPPPGRRGFYAWMVEGDRAAAGVLRRELRESSGYRFITIGTELPEKPVTILENIAGRSVVVDNDEEARKYRQFVGLLSRDKLLPFFKSRREEILKMAGSMPAAKYTAFAEFVAWYYQMVVADTAERLVKAHGLRPPDTSYTYAIKAPPQ